MLNDNENTKSLADYEREKLGNEKNIDEFKNQGRVPDQQNRLKDKENLKK